MVGIDYKPRKLLSKINRYLDKTRVLVLIGSRQVGKSTLLKMLLPKLKGSVHYFNLEKPDDLSLLNEGTAGLKYRGILPPQTPTFLLIDEFQYLAEPNRLFKEIYDTFPTVTIIATGSSSLEIQQKIKESLAGRKLTLSVFPLDFYEYIQFLKPGSESFFDQIDPEGTSAWSKKISVREIEPDFLQFVLYGGLPRVVLECDLETKKVFLDEIYTTYIQKDVKGILQNIEIAAFNKLIQLVSSQTGNLLNICELANTLQLKRQKVVRYLEILEGTFVNFLLNPYATNKRKEVTKTPKTFFYDVGIRNQILKQFAPLTLRADSGALLENAIFLEIKKNLPVTQELSYWRTKNKTEVDFVLRLNENLFPIETKLGPEENIPPNLSSFAESHRVDAAFILNAHTWKREKRGPVTYFWLPHFLAHKIPEWIADR